MVYETPRPTLLVTLKICSMSQPVFGQTTAINNSNGSIDDNIMS